MNAARMTSTVPRPWCTEALLDALPYILKARHGLGVWEGSPQPGMVRSATSSRSEVLGCEHTTLIPWLRELSRRTF